MPLGSGACDQGGTEAEPVGPVLPAAVPGDLVGRVWCFHCCSVDSFPGQAKEELLIFTLHHRLCEGGHGMFPP